MSVHVIAPETTAPRGPSLQERAAESLGGVVVLDLLIGVGLLFDRHPLPGVGQPAGILVMVAAIGLALLRRPTHRLRQGSVVVGLYLVMLAWAVVVSQLSGLSWTQRAAKMVILLTFALVIAQGRVHARSLLVGLGLGLVANVPMYYLGLTTDQYPPYLTGFLGDKNVAGLVYAMVLALGLAVLRSWPLRLLHVAFFATAVFLTGSRTSITAAIVAMLYVLLRNRVAQVVRLASAVGVIWLLDLIETRYARVSIYADRDDTDWFRHQIELATQAKLAAAPWYGEGLTTAWVQLSAWRSIWFHDSYAALRVEGGWVMFAVMLVLCVHFGIGAFETRRVPVPLVLAEAALVAALVCAGKLGEVFFTTPLFLTLGLAWRLRLGEYDPVAAVGRPVDLHAVREVS